MSNMGTTKIERGPVAKRVSDNIRELREGWGARRRLSLTELSERLRVLGRPMLPSALSKIETGERRVDVDDLVTLALALETTPNRLLLTGGREDISLAENVPHTSAYNAWVWATGERGGQWLSHLLWDEPAAPAETFSTENRPHDPNTEIDVKTVVEHAAALDALKEAWRALRLSGVPRRDLLSWLHGVDVAVTMDIGVANGDLRINPDGTVSLAGPRQMSDLMSDLDGDN